jgi:hypothetical protein
MLGVTQSGQSGDRALTYDLQLGGKSRKVKWSKKQRTLIVNVGGRWKTLLEALNDNK